MWSRGHLRYDLCTGHWLISVCYVMITGDLASKLKGYEEEEDDEDDMMAVEGSDGQQYVVLEVIQLADNQGTDQVYIILNTKKKKKIFWKYSLFIYQSKFNYFVFV